MEQVYRVSFHKRLTDSTGHPCDPCQGAVEVRASSQDRAIEIARRMFARLAQVSVWSMHADYETVELLVGRKRISATAWRHSLRETSNNGANQRPKW